MSNLTMDLTGSLENYAVANRVFKISKYGQYIDFNAPVFADSVKVYLISTGINDVQLSLDEDFVIPEEFVSSCDNDLSSATLQDPKFNKKLISGIQMIKPVENGSTYTVAINYQRLYPNQYRTAYIHNEPLNLTPELFRDVLEKVEQHDRLLNRVTDITTSAGDSSILLEVDDTYTNTNNDITNEEHVVNTSGNRFLIHPKGGSFYYSSLVVKYPATGETLELNKDYRIIGMNEAATKACNVNVAGGIYDYILIIKPINGILTIDYHAFGGEPTLDNYRQVLNYYQNLINYLNDSKTLTESSLGKTEILTSVYDRLNALEADMRRLQGTPSYGDITNGKSILMKLFAETQGLHWYTIAKLYKTLGNTSPCTADTFTFRLQSELTHIQMTCAVSVDLSNQQGDRVNASMIADNYPRGYVPFSDYSEINKIVRPQLRVVWNEQDKASGAYLQLGFELKGVLEETIQIEDISGRESCWQLVDEIATVTTPNDSDFKLPDGESTWSTLLPVSRQESTLVPFRKGHLIWAGTEKMNRDEGGWQYTEISGDDLLINKTVDITKIKKLRVNIEEVGGLQFPVDIEFNSGTNHLKGHSGFTYQDQPVYINAEIYYIDSEPVVRLNWDVIAGVDSNELNIRDLVIFL